MRESLYLLLVPLSEALELPTMVRRATAEASRKYVKASRCQILLTQIYTEDMNLHIHKTST